MIAAYRAWAYIGGAVGIVLFGGVFLAKLRGAKPTDPVPLWFMACFVAILLWGLTGMLTCFVVGLARILRMAL